MGAYAVPVARVEQCDVAGHGGRGLRRRRLGRPCHGEFAQPRPPALQGGLYRRQAQLQQTADLFQRMAEHVLEDHAAALRRRQLDEGDTGPVLLLVRDGIARVERRIGGAVLHRLSGSPMRASYRRSGARAAVVRIADNRRVDHLRRYEARMGEPLEAVQDSAAIRRSTRAMPSRTSRQYRPRYRASSSWRRRSAAA